MVVKYWIFYINIFQNLTWNTHGFCHNKLKVMYLIIISYIPLNDFFFATKVLWLACLSVCLSVSLSTDIYIYLKNYSSKFYQISYTCYLCPCAFLLWQCVMCFQWCGWRYVMFSHDGAKLTHMFHSVHLVLAPVVGRQMTLFGRVHHLVASGRSLPSLTKSFCQFWVWLQLSSFLWN